MLWRGTPPDAFGPNGVRVRHPDVDKDGALNDAELDAFATELNGKPFPPEDKEEIQTYFQVTSIGYAAGRGPRVRRADARANRAEGPGSHGSCGGTGRLPAMDSTRCTPCRRLVRGERTPG